MGSRLNSSLSKKGKELAQTKALSLKTAGFTPERVYTSRLLRTKQTADIILEVLGLQIEIIELETLNERGFGKYDGRPLQELLDSFDEHGPNPPTIETVELFVERVVKSLEQIKNESNKSTLIVTHSNPVNVMKSAIFNPSKLQRYWETGNPDYCEGFTYTF